jgi:pimeloyl-ACP methyl ester carboxylesterase
MRSLLAQGYHTINLDARGHGDSEWATDGDYALDTLAGDLECVVKALRSRSALVGASPGGATSLLLAGSRHWRKPRMRLQPTTPSDPAPQARRPDEELTAARGRTVLLALGSASPG